jgi:hypothetical protein
MLRDFVEETTDTSGLVDAVLNGAEPGRRTFAAAFGTGSGNPCLYVMDDGEGNWEIAESYLSDATTIVRGGTQTVRASSNAGNPVDFPVGTGKRIFCDVDAQYLQERAKASRQVNSGTGLTGGGDLTADRALALTGQALALHNLGNNGLITRTGSGTFAARQINAGTGVQVSSNDGVTGNPTVALTGQALDLHNVGNNGFFVKNGPSSVTSRFLEAGDGISITNGAGVNGNPIISSTQSSRLELLASGSGSGQQVMTLSWNNPDDYWGFYVFFDGLGASDANELLVYLIQTSDFGGTDIQVPVNLTDFEEAMNGWLLVTGMRSISGGETASKEFGVQWRISYVSGGNNFRIKEGHWDVGGSGYSQSMFEGVELFHNSFGNLSDGKAYVWGLVR